MTEPRLRSSTTGPMPLALVVRAGSGAGAVVFLSLILWMSELATGRHDDSNAGHVVKPHMLGLGIYFVVLVPVVGGLISGRVIDPFAKEAPRSGPPSVILPTISRQASVAQPRTRTDTDPPSSPGPRSESGPST